MTLKPIFKRPEDIITQKVEEKVKVNVENRIKAEVDRVVNERLKEKEDKEKVDKANKIAKAVDMAKTLKGESEEKDKMTVTEKEKAEKEKAEKEKAEKEKAEKEKAEKERLEKDILCPTCHKGHVHKVETDKSGLVYKCHGDKCDWEAVMVPKNSDYKCSGCGMAIKKPEDPSLMDGCPFCHGKKAVKFDWSKVWNVKK